MITNIFLNQLIFQQKTNVNDGITQIDLYKKAIDNYLATSEKDYLERQIEQQIVMANQGNDSDYLMLNMEYKESVNKGKFDIIALKRSSGNKLPTITLIELKNNTGALDGKSGLEKHLTKMKDFIKNPKSAEFKEDLAKLYEQKCELGLLEYSEEIAAVLKQPLKFEVMFLFTDLEEDSQTLNRILKSEEFKTSYDFDVKIAFLKDKNLKLSEEAVKPLDEFLKQIEL